ncbi:lymphokine-activated killer T-cell-originated protein kinase [Euwallacea similis]|uniref:lymphokine-activated killer T-cell-originated protein kinase n=1 Tax=Euwallacea similis TaxID=1736056 RepID=UPI003450CE18
MSQINVEQFCTPKKPDKKLMNKIKIPPSPYMKKIGYGTGIAVYELQRSPAFNKFRSPWAIKKLITRKLENNLIKTRLKNEAEVLRTLVHPNIIGFRAFLEQKNGNSLLAMEECNSCLGDLIEDRSDNENGPFAAKTIIKVAGDVTQALSYLHNTALIIHGDLKSYNVLVKGDFEMCKLCDFGVYLPVTKDGTVDKEKAPRAEYEGTRSWCAPEILGYTQDITTKADIYSFGLILWEMIALCPPVSEELADNLSKCAELNRETLDDLLETMSTRQRPAIPENVQLGEEYKLILEIYYCCTDEDKKNRPPALDLAVLFHDIQNSQG